MSSERGKERSPSRWNFGWGPLWRRLRGGRGPFGKREVDEDRWTWFGDEAPPKQRDLRRFLLIGPVAVGTVVVLAGALFIVLRTGDAGGPDPAPPSSSARVTDGPSPSAMATDAPSPTSPATAIRISVWDGRVWETDDLTVIRPSDGEGETVPFLLNIEQAVPGQSYNVTLTYECRAGQTLGLEYLTHFNGSTGQRAAQTAPGPQRPFPDTTVVLPDDPSTAGDDQVDLLSVWGATPETVPTGPLPATECVDEKFVVLHLNALTDNVHVLWGAHLGPATAASEDVSLAMRVTVDGVTGSPAELNVLVSG